MDIISNKRGIMQRKAFYALCYGASIRTAVKASGLSIRRVKVIAKQLPTLLIKPPAHHNKEV